ncbi:MAG: aldo/keto reductase [Alkalispirochaetaceae bacterium]
MHLVQLGKSGLLVSQLCLGTMVFGEQGARGTDETDARRMIDRFIDAGGNFIDTADVYAGGKSEQIVGRAIAHHRRDQLVVATKVRFQSGPGANDLGLSRHHIIRGAEASLQRLGTDVIDLYYLHMWDDLAPIEETLRALDDLVTAGKVRYIGVSNFKAWQVMKSLAVSDANGYSRFVAGQYQYSLAVRDVEWEFCELFDREGIAMIPWGPLGGGFLSGKYRRGARPDSGRLAVAGSHHEEHWEKRDTERNWEIIEVMGRIAEERGVTYSQVALNWLRQRSDSIVLGVRTEEQLEDNLGALDWELYAQEADELDAASAVPLPYPYRILQDAARTGMNDRILP